MFKIINGFENYAVDENGIVKNIVTNKIKRPSTNHSGRGYLYCDLYSNGIRKKYFVHRLVAEHFIPNLENKPQVNHIDGNTMNNNASNLEWVVPIENILHSIHVLGNNDPYKIANQKRKRKVKMTDYASGEELAEFSSINIASRITKIPVSAIVNVCKGKQSYSYGFGWQYVEVEE